MSGAIVFLAVISLAYASYRVWFRAEEFSDMLRDLYPESFHVARNLAGSRFTIWGFRLITTLLFFLALAIFLASAFTWLTERLE